MYTHICSHYKKRDYPNICKIAGIAPKSVGIGPYSGVFFLPAHFKLLRSDSRYRVAGPVPTLFRPYSNAF